MSTRADVWTSTMRFATVNHCWILPSGLYDLFPERERPGTIPVASQWPYEWPSRNCHGVYLFFADSVGEPELTYAGRAYGKGVTLGSRLDGYVDLEEFRAGRGCK